MKLKLKRIYRRESLQFRTQKGIEKKIVVVLSVSGESASAERKRLLDKAERMASANGWKLL